jgi:hypothetical protein
VDWLTAVYEKTRQQADALPLRNLLYILDSEACGHAARESAGLASEMHAAYVAASRARSRQFDHAMKAFLRIPGGKLGVARRLAEYLFEFARMEGYPGPNRGPAAEEAEVISHLWDLEALTTPADRLRNRLAQLKGQINRALKGTGYSVLSWRDGAQTLWQLELPT